MSHRITDEVRERILELLNAGVTWDDIADECGVSPSYVRTQAIDAGLYEPTPYFNLFDPQPWSIDALCAETDPESFFPEKGGSTRQAKAMCMKCRVQAECLDWAMERDERFGIWGGLSERERRKLKAALTTPTQPEQQESA